MTIEELTKISALVFVISMAISLLEMFWLTVVSKGESFVHAYAAPLKNAVFIELCSFVLPIMGTLGFALLGAQVAPVSLGEGWYLWPLGL